MKDVTATRVGVRQNPTHSGCSAKFTSSVFAFSCAAFSLLITCTFADDDLGFGKRDLRGGENWAILIGVNCTSRQAELRDGDDPLSRDALPALSNAAICFISSSIISQRHLLFPPKISFS